MSNYPLKRTTWITVNELCDEFNISKKVAYELVHSEGFPVVNIGKKNYRIDRDKAYEIILNNKVYGG